MLTISRKGTFDAGHRVMNERFKCYNMHGHTYLYELTFHCDQLADIGYTIDFKEIKRVLQQWIDDNLDHAQIINPKDYEVKNLCVSLQSKHWMMNLSGAGNYCNPTVENLAQELWAIMDYMTGLMNIPGLHFKSIKLYETPNCFAECMEVSIDVEDAIDKAIGFDLRAYIADKGSLEYDDRRIRKP